MDFSCAYLMAFNMFVRAIALRGRYESYQFIFSSISKQ
jgi:hypothetical protein